MPTETLETRESKAVVASLRPRRRQAKKHPLSRNDTLVFKGPPLRSDVLPQLSSTSPDAPQSPPRRIVDSSLFHHLEHTPRPQQHAVTLRSPLRSGKDRYSQVWQADVDLGDGRSAPVVLKLVVEALFPEPDEDWWEVGRPWRNAQELVMREGDAYAAFSSIQGSVVPYCYGTYEFDLPFGETVVGFVLEDIVAFSLPLPIWFKGYHRRFLRGLRREHAGQSHSSDDSSIDSSDEEPDVNDGAENLRFDEMRPLLDRIFGTLDALHDQSRVGFKFAARDFRIVGSLPSQVEVVATSFALSESQQEWEKDLYASEARAIEEDGEDGRQSWTSWRDPEVKRMLKVLGHECLPWHVVLAYKHLLIEAKEGQ